VGRPTLGNRGGDVLAMTIATELARPKVNLTLEVLGRRPDGYHELESLVAFASGVGDRLSLAPGGSGGLRVSGPFAPSITGDNLVARALQMLAELEPQLVLGGVLLDKELPVSAGLGGGSSDAAALLRLVRRANPTLAPSVDWRAIASALGADVPVCFEDRAALMWGIGEHTIELPDLPRLPALLVNPLAEVPAAKTAEVFRRLAAPPLAGPSRARPKPGCFPDSAALVEHLRDRHNDLTDPARALMPVIDDVLGELARAPGTLLARLSGAGPTAFGIYDSGFAALTAARVVAARRPRWWVRPVWLG
jgi:4-diphosphocytidyl-2-C-methyl-D-erythritol kinase